MDYIIKLLRILLQIPIYTLNNISVLYSKVLILIDPNGSECLLEEMYQKQINSKINSNLNITNSINYNPKLYNIKKKIDFYTPTKITSFRAKTIYSKEPETIMWIDEFGGKKKIFFDVGANIGVYSLYYAKLYASNTKNVYSFEAQENNISLLKKNTILNKSNNQIVTLPFALFNKNEINYLIYSQENKYGIAATSFGKKSIFAREKTYKNLTISFNIDFLINNFIIPKPNLIKIDVDGNELDIVLGAIKTINSKKCQSILIEKGKDIDQIHRLLSKKFKIYFDGTSNRIYINKNLII